MKNPEDSFSCMGPAFHPDNKSPLDKLSRSLYLLQILPNIYQEKLLRRHRSFCMVLQSRHYKTNQPDTEHMKLCLAWILQRRSLAGSVRLDMLSGTVSLWYQYRIHQMDKEHSDWYPPQNQHHIFYQETFHQDMLICTG
jgi:hypothetical protein